MAQKIYNQVVYFLDSNDAFLLFIVVVHIELNGTARLLNTKEFLDDRMF